MESLRQSTLPVEPVVAGSRLLGQGWAGQFPPFRTEEGPTTSASRLEGIDDRIKVIKRMAYGVRDDVYCFSRIRAAFPGNPG